MLKKRKNHGRGRACCCCVRAFFVYLPRVFIFFAMVKKVRPALCRRIRMAQLQAAAPVKVIEPVTKHVEVEKKPVKGKSKSS